MQDVSVTCFGVGEGMPCGDRNHSAYLFRLGGAAFLVDCGDPISRSYKASGLSYDLVDRVLLSHLHADHFGGFFMLLQSFWLERRARPLPVHLPAEGVAPVRQMVNAAYLYDELLPFRLGFEPLAPHSPITQGGATVTPFPTTHLEGFRKSFSRQHPAEFASYSFLFETEGCRLAHSADVGAVSDLEPLLSEPLDLLVCELSHCEAEELFAFLQGRAIRRLALVHLSRRYWDRLDETRQLAARRLPGIPVVFPRDGDVISL